MASQPGGKTQNGMLGFLSKIGSLLTERGSNKHSCTMDSDMQPSDDVFKHIEMARDFEKRGDIELAIKTCRFAINTCQFPAYAHEELIRILSDSGRCGEAIEAIDNYIGNLPEYLPQRVVMSNKKRCLQEKIDGIIKDDEHVTIDVETFKNKYKEAIPDDLFIDLLVSGRKEVSIKKELFDEIHLKRTAQDRFDRMILDAARINNEGIALEKKGDIYTAIAKYEENILPDTHLTLHPYHRLCVLYRRFGDYENEIRVIETCLARPEWKDERNVQSKELAFFKDRLIKAKSYQSKGSKS